MCTRYFIEKDAPELKKIIEAVSVSSLAARFRNHYGRPVRTNGEIRPTDIVPVIAPDKNGRISMTGCQTAFPLIDSESKKAAFFINLDSMFHTDGISKHIPFRIL